PSPVAEGIVKALCVGQGLRAVPEMPFPNVRGGIAAGFEHFRDRDLSARHPGIPLCRRQVGWNSCPNRQATGHESGARRRTDGRCCVHLGEPHPALRESIEVRSAEVLGTIAAEVQRTLIVAINKQDIGAWRRLLCAIHWNRTRRYSGTQQEEQKKESLSQSFS